MIARIGTVMSGTSLAGAALVVAANDPAAPDSRFPACVFHELTGWWCPGCGLTRGAHALLRGDLLSALSSNVFTPLVIAAIALSWWAWTRRVWGRTPWRWPITMPRSAGPALFAVVVAYGVIRNLPGLSALAP